MFSMPAAYSLAHIYNEYAATAMQLTHGANKYSTSEPIDHLKHQTAQNRIPANCNANYYTFLIIFQMEVIPQTLSLSLSSF